MFGSSAQFWGSGPGLCNSVPGLKRLDVTLTEPQLEAAVRLRVSDGGADQDLRRRPTVQDLQQQIRQTSCDFWIVHHVCRRREESQPRGVESAEGRGHTKAHA